MTSVEQPDQDGAEHKGNELALDPVPAPRSPALHRDSVFLLDGFAVDVERQGQDCNVSSSSGENTALCRKLRRGKSLTPVTEFGRELPAQDEPQHYDSVHDPDQVQAEMDAVAAVRLGVQIGRQAVLGDWGAGVRRQRRRPAQTSSVTASVPAWLIAILLSQQWCGE